MESAPSICAYNLPGNKGYKMVSGLSRETIRARNKLKVKTNLEVPFKEELRLDPKGKNSELVCHYEPELPVRFSQCMMKRTKLMPYSKDPDDTLFALNKNKVFLKTLGRFYCPFYANCQLSRDEELAELCYEVACNDIGAPCAVPGEKMTQEQKKQKAAAMEKYQVTYYEMESRARPFYYIEKYVPSICLTNEGFEENWVWDKSPKNKLQKVLFDWDCPTEQGFERCRSYKNMCTETKQKHKLPDGKCKPDLK